MEEVKDADWKKVPIYRESAMGFQYNGKLRSAELLLEDNGSVKEIRRAETLDDYFATLDLSSFS